MKTRAHGKGASTAEVPVYRTEANRVGLMSIYEAKLCLWPVRDLLRPNPVRQDPCDRERGSGISAGDPPPSGSHQHAGVGAPVPALAGRYRIYAPDTIGDVGRSELGDFDVYPKRAATSASLRRSSSAPSASVLCTSPGTSALSTTGTPPPAAKAAASSSPWAGTSSASGIS